jgi:hypothetical protein
MSPYPLSAYGPPPGPPPNDDTLGWVGIAASCASWLACCCTPIPFLGLLANFVGLVLATGGTVCGAIAYRNAKRGGGRTDLALVGLLIGAARLVLTLGAIGVLLVLVAVIGVAGVADYVQRAGH